MSAEHANAEPEHGGYPYELVRAEEDGGFFAHHPELEGCFAQGKTADEAIENLDAARKMWIEACLEDGHSIPKPPKEEPSGRVSLRMRRRLHGQLNRLAERDSVSLNHLITSALEAFVGNARAERRAEQKLEHLRESLEQCLDQVGRAAARAESLGAASNLAPESVSPSQAMLQSRWEDAGPVHKAAYRLIVTGHDQEAKELLDDLPSRHMSDFFRGLAYLRQPSAGEVEPNPERGYELCIRAKRRGLGFHEASLVWECIPTRLDFNELRRQLFSPVFKDNLYEDVQRTSASAKLLAWIEMGLNNRVRVRRWSQVARNPRAVL